MSKYLVNIPGYHGSGWGELNACDYEDAAEKASDEYNEGAASGEEDVVQVKDPNSGVTKIFGVVSEYSVVYRTREIKMNKKNGGDINNDQI